jgi:hypothetical protein
LRKNLSALVGMTTLAACLATPPAAHAQDEGRAYKVAITDNNRVGLTITNYGFFGNNFTSRSPSFEFPLGTGFEHLVRGGLWIGATSSFSGSGEVTRVTTGAVDGQQGGASAAATEYGPSGDRIVQRSNLPNSRVFSPLAVSEQDFVTVFNDYERTDIITAGEDHEPLGVLVNLETYDWSFARFANFIAVHFKIRNVGPPLRNVWVGMYEEFASGPKAKYGTWPPQSSNSSGLGTWYGKKLMGYVDSMRMVTEHYCVAFTNGIASCQDEVCPPYVGIQLLGVRPDTVANKQVTFFMANWAPGDTTRDQDRERYNLMSTGRITPPDSLLPGENLTGRPNDPVSLLAVGPFDEILPDSSISVDFAFVGGDTYEDLLANADFAQLAFNFNYVIPTPPPSPRLAIVPTEGGLDLYWDRSPEEATDTTSPMPGGKDFEGYRVYIGEDRGRLSQVAQFDLQDTTGFNTGLSAIALPDSIQIDGQWYHHHYRLTNLKTGFRYYASVTSFDIGDSQIESLESGLTQNLALTVPAPSPDQVAGRKVSVFPNPYKVEAKWDAGKLVRDHYLWFANLPQRCTIRIYTLSGDLVKQVDFDGATYHGESARGLYNPSTDTGIDPPALSGSVYAWDLITDQGQAVASGLYLFAVESPDGGETQRGKFLIVKSDREGFE